jgi:integrase
MAQKPLPTPFDLRHTFLAIGITTYLENRGTLEHAQIIANHASPRTTKLYYRIHEELSVDKIGFESLWGVASGPALGSFAAHPC